MKTCHPKTQKTKLNHVCHLDLCSRWLQTGSHQNPMSRLHLTHNTWQCCPIVGHPMKIGMCLHPQALQASLPSLLYLASSGRDVTLVCQLSCKCSRLTRTQELMKLSCKLSLVNSHATLVLVWPEHKSWWNSHANSRLWTLMQLLFSFDQESRNDMRVDETLMRVLSQLAQ